MRIGLLLASTMLAASCNASDYEDPNQMQTTGDMDTAGLNDGSDLPQTPGEQPVTASPYVMLATMTDMYEIAAGQMAMEKGNSSTTRDFGRMMVNDHTTSLRDMKAAVEKSDLRITIPTQLDAEHEAMIVRLERATDEEFDREYMRQQMAGHRKALEMHREYQEVSDDPNLMAFSQKILPVIQRHYDRLEQVGADDGETTNISS